MSRRRGRLAQSRISTARDYYGPLCYITKLPTEILIQIIQYLHVENDGGFEQFSEKDDFYVYKSFPRYIQRPSADFASVVRVSRLFYEIAMPLLWNVVKISRWKVAPLPLLAYPGTPSQCCALKYIQRMYLNTDPEDYNMDESSYNRLWGYISRCRRVVVAAGSLQYLNLCVHLHDPDDCAPELRNKVKSINRLTFQILEHVKRMNIQQLEFTAAPRSAGLDDIMRILERKIDSLDLFWISLGSWIDRRFNLQNLTEISARRFCRLGDDDKSNVAMFNKFWVVISQLENVLEVDATGIPISPALGLRFPHLIRLRFSTSRFSASEVAGSFFSVIKQMPNLESLDFNSHRDPEYEQELRHLGIYEVACKNLRVIKFNGQHPKELVATIAKHNPNLVSCILDETMTNVDDEDIRYLSRCQNLRELKLKSSIDITSGLEYLTDLPLLHTLVLHHSLGKCMSTQLVVDISSSCRNLREIEFPYSFNFQNPPDDFAFPRPDLTKIFTEDELHPYIEPSYHRIERGKFAPVMQLNKYIIRLDKLRKDLS